MENHKVALVLSSGGARGLAHVGVIEELIKNGFEITSIAGSSIGALVGGVYAAGTLDPFKKWITTLDYWDVFQLMDFTFSTNGFIKGEKVFKKMEDFIGSTKIEELAIPFFAIASDILNNKAVCFTEGSLYDAVRASVAIPTVLKPKYINHAPLVDGGVVAPIPLDYIHKKRGVKVIAVNVNSTIPPRNEREETAKEKNRIEEFTSRWLSKDKPSSPSKDMSYFGILNRSLDLTQDIMSKMAIEKHKPDMVVNISKDACSTMQFHRSQEMIDLGRVAFHEAFSKSELNSKIRG